MQRPCEPSGGWIEGRTHVFPVRVYYEDTDFSGVVYHANYLRFMERGRSEFLRLVGAGHQGMLANAEPLVWAVRRMKIEFLRPARMEEALTVRTERPGIGGRAHAARSGGAAGGRHSGEGRSRGLRHHA